MQDGIRAWGFAGEGRPSLEQTTLEGATWAREKVEGLVLSSAVSEVGDFTGFLRLRTHSQNKTVAARAMAERKTVGQRS